MNEFRIRESGQVVTEPEFRAMHNVAFPNVIDVATLDEYGADPVLASPQPAITTEQTSSRNGVVLDALGNWVWAWQVSAIPAEVLAANLVAAKTAKNLQINTWRGEANQSTFTYLGKLINCDALSRSDIDAVAGNISLTGAFPTDFPNGWKCTDNTFVSIPTVAVFKEFYTAMTAQGSVNFAYSQTLKATLTSATTIDEVNDIVWIPQ